MKLLDLQEKTKTILVTIFEMESEKFYSLRINYVQASIQLQFSNSDL